MDKEEQIKERILVAANGLFNQYGLKKTTMDDIANSVGMAKSSLYYYFKNKDDVFENVLTREMDFLRAEVDQEVRKQASIRGKLVTHSCVFHEQVLQRENLYRIVKSKDSDPKFKQHLKRIINREILYVKNLVTYGIVSGEITTIKEEQIEGFSEIIVASLFGITQYVFEVNQDFSTDKFKDMMKFFVPRIL